MASNPQQPRYAGTKMSKYFCIMMQQEMMQTLAVSYQPELRHETSTQINIIIIPTLKLFTGWIGCLYLGLTQQCQSTEGNGLVMTVHYLRIH